jgi:cytochrome c biogenesis protein CcmG/thiol:disulfide interchange protein DsbE
MLKRLARIVVAAVISLLALAPGLPAIAPPATADRPCSAGARAANLDFVLKDAHGTNLRLASARGNVVVLNFWATWCQACREEMLDLAALQTRYQKQGLQVFGISVDDSAGRLKADADSRETSYPLLIGLRRDDLQDFYGPVWDVPRTFVIDRNGSLCRRYNNAVTREQIETTINGLLSEKAPRLP